MIFLSDLCGREAALKVATLLLVFLSDLCGREVELGAIEMLGLFLSDLCGREAISMEAATTQLFF